MVFYGVFFVPSTTFFIGVAYGKNINRVDIFYQGFSLSDKRHYILAHDTARRLAAAQCMTAPDGYHVRVDPPTRSLEQSAKFHAICADIARQKEFAGKMRSPEQWKMLLVSGHAVATKRGSEMLPGLEGEWCNLRESTAAMGVKRLSSLIEYTIAWCAENEIVLHDERMAA